MVHPATLLATTVRSVQRIVHAVATVAQAGDLPRNETRELIRIRARAAQASIRMDRAAYLTRQAMLDAVRDSEIDGRNP